MGPRFGAEMGRARFGIQGASSYLGDREGHRRVGVGADVGVGVGRGVEGDGNIAYEEGDGVGDAGVAACASYEAVCEGGNRTWASFSAFAPPLEASVPGMAWGRAAWGTAGASSEGRPFGALGARGWGQSWGQDEGQSWGQDEGHYEGHYEGLS